MLMELEIKLLYIERGGVWLVLANFLVSESFVFAAVHKGQVLMFL